MDYQNVHITAADGFNPGRPRHESLIHPYRYANALIAERNSRQRDGQPLAELARVRVFRGLPSPEHDPEGYARNMAQQDQWGRNFKIRVTQRPLKYDYQWGSDGNKVRDIHGNPIVRGKREKGIDVLCAVAVLEEAAHHDCDLVILASQDTDLIPALEAAQAKGAAKIETASWFVPRNHSASKELQLERRLWNTRLNREVFEASVDPNIY